jgi:hypothetical protein
MKAEGPPSSEVITWSCLIAQFCGGGMSVCCAFSVLPEAVVVLRSLSNRLVNTLSRTA